MLEVKNVSVSYGDKTIVDNLSISVQPRETVSIVGESGSGKSTLLKAILGLLGAEGWISGGTIEFEGRDLTSLGPEEMRKLRGAQIATVYQQAGRSMDPVTRIGKQFHEALLTKGKISRQESDRKAADCMRQLSLKNPEKILKSYPVMLSGGTNQRVALAMSMVMEPKLLLADEPTSALDVTVQVQVVEAMQHLKESCQAAILMVTHNIGVVAQMADKVGVMYNGHLMEWGTREQILSEPLHPYTRMLMNSVLRMDGFVPEGKAVYRERTAAGCPFYSRCPRVDKLCRCEMPKMKKTEDGHQIMCHLA